MKLASIAVQNFKGLRNVQVPLSRFVCVIGANNAGKSSLLQALMFFLEGKKLAPSHFFDPAADVAVRVRLEDITDGDLGVIQNEEQRRRVREILADGAITLVRRFTPTGTVKLRWIARVPKDPRFSTDAVAELLDGKRAKELAEAVAAKFPELAGKLDGKPTQALAKSLIAELARGLPPEDKHEQEQDLPTGLDTTLAPLLPEPIYIPAVKDLADDIKTKEGASFGKLLNILLKCISDSPELVQAQKTFEQLNSKLNRVVGEDGEPRDERLEAVREIEATVQGYVRDNFPTVSIDIRVPPPELKTILSGAELHADDGVRDRMETKGDGLKRTVTFALLRSYARLYSDPKFNAAAKPTCGFVLLFEEPELYLHPSAQRVLFDALKTIAKSAHVVVSTHSPQFFGANATETFIKMVKRPPAASGGKPFGHAIHIDLSDVRTKDRFQIISYETNNMAFFSSAVLLVEGDTDYIVFPHMARVLNPDWSVDRAGIAVCPIRGKGNISRYRDFFNAFDVRVMVLADLDCLLEGFQHVGADGECRALQSRLVQAVDAVRAAGGQGGAEPNGKQLKRVAEDPTLKERWIRAAAALQNAVDGKADPKEFAEAGAALFAQHTANSRRFVLEQESDATVSQLKHELLARLRALGIHVLRKGAVEEYIPVAVTGGDKPTRALRFCEQVTTPAEILALCDEISLEDGRRGHELDIIFRSIFDYAAQRDGKDVADADAEITEAAPDPRHADVRLTLNLHPVTRPGQPIGDNLEIP